VLTEAQQRMRKTGIGGSEIAAVLGESRFATPFDVWLAKTQGWVIEETEDMRRGSFLEDGLARWYAHRMGVPEKSMVVGETLRHRDRKVALCTPDRFVRPDSHHYKLVSIKCPRRKTDLWGAPSTDNVPPEYLLQLQWEHAICRSTMPVLPEMELAAFLDGDLVVYRTEADEELQAWMLDYAETWWERHVMREEPPPLDGSTQAREWLKRKFPTSEAQPRETTPHEVRLCVELEVAEAEATRWESEAETIRNGLKLSMGPAQGLQAPNGSINWKANTKGIRSFKPKWNKKEK
jgi:putative phage-type endonuclease